MWIPPKFGLIQEKYWPDGWKILICCLCLNLTKRAQMEPVSINPDGLIKVAPLLHWSSKELHDYCQAHDLPNNFDYVDPTKGEDNRECGLHISH
jgi:hypothetical protein